MGSNDYRDLNDQSQRSEGERPRRSGGNHHRGRDDRGPKRFDGDRREGGRRWEDRGERRGGDRREGDRREGGRRWEDRGERRGGDRREGDRREGGRRWEDRGERRGGDRREGDRREGGRRWEDRGERRGGDRREGDRREGGRRWEDRGERRGGERRDGDRREAPRRQHAQRGGGDRDRRNVGPQRPGFREERLDKRRNEPDLPGDIDVRDLDPMVLQDLKVLSKDNAHAVAQHMIMAATLMQDDPELALRHARAAKDRAGRVAVVRETLGIAAYHAGEWKEALSELRAARRMSNGPGLVAVMADAERGLGRPEKAIEISKEVDPAELDAETRIELAIVVAGARLDLGQPESALVTLQRENPDAKATGFSAARLSYAYADVLLENGQKQEAREWFAAAVEQDVDEYTDARQRLEALNIEQEKAEGAE